eukprot:1193936-Prorocentrum_minimum.AAC.4
MVDAEGHLESSPGKHTDLVQKASLLAKAFALVRKDDAKRVNELFKQKGLSSKARDPRGNTLLHASVAAGAINTAKAVLNCAVYGTQPPDLKFLELANYEGQVRTSWCTTIAPLTRHTVPSPSCSHQTTTHSPDFHP